MATNDEPQRRLARNETLYRKVNEAIERGLWPGESDEFIRFRCECARADCNADIGMTVGQYEAVRRDPRRFLLCDGHQFPELEVVVERYEAYLVVEKEGQAGIEAEESDPRHA